MKYEIQDLEKSCLTVGLSKNLIQAIIQNLPQKRSSKENSALHVLFTNISFELTRMGRQFVFKGVKGIDIEINYTPELVKECIWKPLQSALMAKSSTTELTHSDIEMIFEILAKWFSEQGIEVYFPSIESLNLKIK